MTRRGLITNYLREAAAQAGPDVTAQLAWLETQRVALTAEVNTGGQIVLETSLRGTSNKLDGGISPGLRLEAVNAATDRLNGISGGGGALIIPRFRHTPI